jgi:hypothetical protein
MCAIAQKVVPRSMPIALRVAISEKSSWWNLSFFHLALSAVFMPNNPGKSRSLFPTKEMS